MGIRVTAVLPGSIKSDLGSNTQVGADQIADYDVWRERAFKRHQEEEENAPDPKRVADTVLKIINDPSPQPRYLLGKEVKYYYMDKFMPAGMAENGRRNYWKLDVK